MMSLLDAATRAMRAAVIPPGAKTVAGDGAPSDSIKHVALAGWLIIAVFFGGIGAWATTAPLNGAVVANAVVKVDGNRKSIQHLDGGIVKELHVKEGDKVNAGDVLVVLDETQARAEFDVLSQEYVVLRATETRLLTELDRGSELVMPADLKARPADTYIKSVWNGQISQFDSRRAALEGQRSVIREKINQLKHDRDDAVIQARQDYFYRNYKKNNGNGPQPYNGNGSQQQQKEQKLVTGSDSEQPEYQNSQSSPRGSTTQEQQ